MPHSTYSCFERPAPPTRRPGTFLCSFHARELSGGLGCGVEGFSNSLLARVDQVFEGLHETRQDVGQEKVLEFNQTEGRDEDVPQHNEQLFPRSFIETVEWGEAETHENHQGC